MHPDDVCDGSDDWAAPDGDDGRVECMYCGRRVGFNPRSRPQRGGRRKLARHGRHGSETRSPPPTHGE